jgi:hypothetical protein
LESLQRSGLCWAKRKSEKGKREEREEQGVVQSRKEGREKKKGKKKKKRDDMCLEVFVSMEPVLQRLVEWEDEQTGESFESFEWPKKSPG